jgi:hypothetical protein
MNVWMDGLSVLTNEWRLVTVILALVLSSLSLTNLLLRKVFGDRLSRAEYLAL